MLTGETLIDDVVPLNTGLLVTPFAPMYHWYVSVPPVAVTLTCAALPYVIVEPDGCVLICGAVHVTVTVAALLSLLPQGFETLTQYEVVLVGLTVIDDNV